MDKAVDNFVSFADFQDYFQVFLDFSLAVSNQSKPTDIL